MIQDHPTQSSYDLSAEAYAKNVHSLHPEKQAAKFIHMLPSPSTILDAGCGTGRDARIFSQAGIQVIGIDFSEKMLEIARQTAPQAEFYLMNLESLSFPLCQFHGIWACASLLHLPKSKMNVVLHALHRLLQPKGVLYMRIKKGIGEGLIKDHRYGGLEKFFAFFLEEEISTHLIKSHFEIASLEVEEKSHSPDTHPFIDIFAIKSSGQ